MNMALLVLLLLFIGLVESSKSNDNEDFPFRNVSLDWSVRVDDLVSRLTPDEIIDQMDHAGGWNADVTPAIPRLGILPYFWRSQCLHGFVNENSTAFPQAINLASTWNKELVKAVANVTAYEVHAYYNRYRQEGMQGVNRGLTCFSPVINIMRHPLWGRNQETYGECPYLTGMFAIYFVHGLQGPSSSRYLNTNALCKHFDVHDGPENNPVSRLTFNVNISEFDWRSTFLPAFHACVNAGAHAIMCSYNSINGIPACANSRLLIDILRQGMNFTGFVVSDYDAILYMYNQHHYVNTTEDAALVAVKAGVNVEVAGSNSTTFFQTLHQAYKEGKIDNQTFIERLKPLMYTRMRLGEFDPIEMNSYNNISMDVVQSDSHRNLARQVALQSFVLLKNQNDFLPIRNTAIYPNVLFLGPMSDNPKQQYGDYTPLVEPQYVSTPLSSLNNSFRNTAYKKACLDGTRCLQYNQTDIINYLTNNSFDLIILSLGTGQDVEREGNDRITMSLPNKQSQLLEDVLNVINPQKTKILLLIMSASPLDIQLAQESDHILGILQLGFSAQELGEALKMAIIGEGVSKFGRLPYTWPKNLSDLPGDLTFYEMTRGFTYRYARVEPLYSFGYGLSYSNFFYYNISFNATYIKPGDGLIIYFNVKNTGPRISDEVIQVYLSIQLENTSLANVSVAQLVAFDRLSDMNPSEIVLYQTIIRQEQMAVYIDGQGFVIVPATLEFKIGSFIQPYLSGSVTIDGPMHNVGQYISYASV